ncbi:unnamed protein product [Blepharisma stoltei]|uniref:Uncharacterized protein n=1 Tax=Blepharisma stoltei TaxID=1481888 RepID=A0AAU9IM80_9CILI|nr:unnamed protein product [Blepharisma stoltei]
MGNCFCDKLRTEKEIQSIVSDNVAVNSERFSSPMPSTRRNRNRSPVISFDSFDKENFPSLQEDKLRNILNESKHLASQLKRLRGEDVLPEDWPRASDCSKICEIAEEELAKQIDAIYQDMNSLIKQVEDLRQHTGVMTKQ